MLEVKNLDIQYGNNFVAVNNFELNLNKGEIVAIVGESGSGKSTSVKALMGILPANAKVLSGTVNFEDMDLLKFSQKQWKSIRAKQISMIFQDSGNSFNPVRKIGSIFVEYIQAHSNISKESSWKLALNMLEKVHLGNTEQIMKSYPHHLSGGMRQRVSIAIAMTFSPKLLIADEPTSALDVTIQAQIIKQMMEFRDTNKTSIVIVTHNIGIAAYMADKIIVMKDGCIVETGRNKEVLTNPKSNYAKELVLSVPKLGGVKIG